VGRIRIFGRERRVPRLAEVVRAGPLVALVIVVLGPRYLPNADWRTFVREEIPNISVLLGAIVVAWTKPYWVHATIVLAMLGYTVWDYLPNG
jgi:hypothetical protein